MASSQTPENDLNNLLKGIEDMDIKAEEVVDIPQDTEEEGAEVAEGGIIEKVIQDKLGFHLEY